MAISPDDVLRCARDLSGQPNMREANARTVVGRAYYAAYHDCKAWYTKLSRLGSVPENTPKGMHVEFCAELMNPHPLLSEDLKTASKARGSRLRALHGDRVESDYDLNALVEAFDGRNAINEAIGIKGIQ